MLGIATATSVAAVMGGADVANLDSVVQISVIGAGMFAFGALRLPRWARLRRKQMEELAGRLTHRPTLQPAQDADEDH